MSFMIPGRRGLMDIGWSPVGGASLDLNFLGQDQYAVADLRNGAFKAWDNDPSAASKLGKYQSRSKAGQLSDKLFGGLLTFSRSSVAYGYGPDGNLKQFAVDQPRFEFDPVTLKPVGLRIEESHTNYIPNNTMVGAVPGSPGTLPTGWSYYSPGSPLLQIVGTSTINGIDYIDIRFAGTTTASTGTIINVTFLGSAGAANGQSWARSDFLAMVGGSWNNITGLGQQCAVNSATPAYLGELAGSGTNLKSSLTSTMQRFSFGGTLAYPTAATISPYIQIQTVAGAAIDITLRIGLPQLEQGVVATSPIKTTNAGAVTRAADYLDGSLSGWYNPANSAIVVEGMFPSNPNTNAFLYSITDGSTYNNEIRAFVTSTLGVTGSEVANGVNSNLFSSTGIITPGTPFRIGINAGQANNMSINGAAVLQASGAISPPTVSKLSIGRRSGAGESFWVNGFIRRLTYYPRALSSAELQAATEWSADLVLNGMLDQSVSFTRNSIGTYFDKYGVMQTAQVDCPRLDYDPVTGVFKGLLVEESRTNWYTNSLSGIGGGAGGNSSTTSTAVPSFLAGTTIKLHTRGDPSVYTDDNCGANTATGTTWVAGTTYAFSIYMWLSSGVTYQTTNGLGPRMSIEGTGWAVTAFADLSKRDQWQRVVAISTPTGTVGNPALVIRYGGTIPAANGGYLYSCLPQAETGSFATSYIPTTSGAVTRAADFPTVSNLPSRDWWSATSVSVAATVNAIGTGNTLWFGDGTSANRFHMGRGSGLAFELWSVTGSTVDGAVSGGNWPAGTDQKIAFAQALNDDALCANGTLLGTDSSVAVPPLTTAGSGLWIGHDQNGGGQFSGWIKRLTVKGRRASNAELQALSA